MLRIAKVDALPVRLQHQLWQSGDPLVRQALVQREDLDPALTALAVTDPTLVGSWITQQRRPGKDFDLAVHTILGSAEDHALMRLVQQDALRADQAVALAPHCGGQVGWYLLQHHRGHLPLEVAQTLVRNYVQALDPRTDGPGRAFEEVLDEDEMLWVAAAEAAGDHTLPVLRSAAFRSGRHPELRESVMRTLERVDATVTIADDRSLRIFDSVIGELLNSPYLGHDDLARLARLRHATPARVEELTDRSDLGLASLLASLDCPVGAQGNPDHDPGDPAHLAILRRLAALPGYTNLPGDLLARAALAHQDGLDERELDALISRCRGPQSRQLAVELDRVGGQLQLLTLARHAGLPALGDIPDPTEVYVALARIGAQGLNDREIPPALRAPVAAAYRPLQRLLREPHLASTVIARLDALAEPARTIALGLVAEWEGDLVELETTAHSLAAAE